MIGIGLLGFGTVGTGFYEILCQQLNQMEIDYGERIQVKAIAVNDLLKDRGYAVQHLLTDQALTVVTDPNIHIIIEVMGTETEAYHLIKAALLNDKHVITANKAVMSKYFTELHGIADSRSVQLLYEASVGGGMPIIAPLKRYSASNVFTEIKGILNGTSNYILTHMFSGEDSFETVLKQAQEKGYAEQDPSDDIEGQDVVRKLSILSNLAFKVVSSPSQIYRRGIQCITKEDVTVLRAMGRMVKLMAHAHRSPLGYYSVVEPVALPDKSIFSGVRDVFNIVEIVGSTIGKLQFYGRGAGKLPTGNAVFNDLIEILNKGRIHKMNPILSDVQLKLPLASYYIGLGKEKNQKLFRSEAWDLGYQFDTHVFRGYWYAIVQDADRMKLGQLLADLFETSVFYARLEEWIE